MHEKIVKAMFLKGRKDLHVSPTMDGIIKWYEISGGISLGKGTNLNWSAVEPSLMDYLAQE